MALDDRFTPLKVNIAALKMDGWKIKSPFGMAYFQKPSLVVLHNTEAPIMSSFSGIVRFWFSCPITRMLLMSSYHEPGSWGLKARSVAIIVHKLFGTSYKLLTKQNLMLSFKCVFLQKKSFQDLFAKKNTRPFSCWCWSHTVSLRIRQWNLKCEMSLWQMPWCVVTDIYHVYTQAVVLHVWQDGLLRWVWPPPSNSGQWTFRLDLFSNVMSSWWSLLLRGGQIHDIFTKHFRYLR